MATNFFKQMFNGSTLCTLSIRMFQCKLWYKFISPHFFLCIKRPICHHVIVDAMQQLFSIKAVVGVDFPAYALSMHQIHKELEQVPGGARIPPVGAIS